MPYSIERIGWFGLGSMGLGMSLNLQKHLHQTQQSPLRFSNRTLSKGLQLIDAGGIPEGNFSDVVRNSDVIFTMISNDDVLNELYSDLLASGVSLKDKIFVDTSTVHPDTCEASAQLLHKHEAVFIAAPVFGASAVAATGKLIFTIAGQRDAIDTIKPLIVPVMGRSIIDMGDNVRNSSLLKICGNILVISFMEVISETHVFAESTGVGTQQLEEFIANMFGPVLESYSKRITTGAYAPPEDVSPGFAAALACKDMKHALSIASSHSVKLPTVETASSNLTAARDYAGEHLDSSSIYGRMRMEGGLPFWSQNSRQCNDAN